MQLHSNCTATTHILRCKRCNTEELWQYRQKTLCKVKSQFCLQSVSRTVLNRFTINMCNYIRLQHFIIDTKPHNIIDNIFLQFHRSGNGMQMGG